MKCLGLILFQLIFLIRFCFKNLDLSAIQLAHLDLCLITLFVIVTFSLYYLYVFWSLNNRFACFYIMGNIFLTINFRHLAFIELLFSNSSSNNLLQILSINDFLVSSSVDSLVDFIFVSLI